MLRKIEFFKRYWPIENRAYQGIFVAGESYMKNRHKEERYHNKNSVLITLSIGN